MTKHNLMYSCYDLMCRRGTNYKQGYNIYPKLRFTLLKLNPITVCCVKILKRHEFFKWHGKKSSQRMVDWTNEGCRVRRYIPFQLNHDKMKRGYTLKFVKSPLTLNCVGFCYIDVPMCCTVKLIHYG